MLASFMLAALMTLSLSILPVQAGERLAVANAPTTTDPTNEAKIQEWMAKIQKDGGEVLAVGRGDFTLPKSKTDVTTQAGPQVYPSRCTLVVIVYRTQPYSKVGNSSLSSCSMKVVKIDHWFQSLKRSRWYGWEQMAQSSPYANNVYSLGYTTPLISCYGTTHDWWAETAATIDYAGQLWNTTVNARINGFKCS